MLGLSYIAHPFFHARYTIFSLPLLLASASFGVCRYFSSLGYVCALIVATLSVLAVSSPHLSPTTPGHMPDCSKLAKTIKKTQGIVFLNKRDFYYAAVALPNHWQNIFLLADASKSNVALYFSNTKTSVDLEQALSEGSLSHIGSRDYTSCQRWSKRACLSVGTCEAATVYQIY